MAYKPNSVRYINMNCLQLKFLNTNVYDHIVEVKAPLTMWKLKYALAH